MEPRREKVVFENVHGQKLRGVLHHPSKTTKKAVIICHGFGSSKEFPLLWHIADAIAAKGIAALRFDFTGCGESEGQFSQSTYSRQQSDLGSALIYMNKEGYSDFALCGHSMGGAVSFLIAQKSPLVKALIDLCAPSHPSRDMVKKFGINIRDGTYSFSLGKKTYSLNKAFIDDLEHVNIEDAARKLKIPLLFVHGTADKIVPYSQSEHLHLLNTSADNTLEPIEGADHLFTGRHEEVAKIVAYWVRKHLAK